MIGEKIRSNQTGKVYTITKEVTSNPENARVFICQDEETKEFIFKYFYTGRAVAFTGYNKKNHYGRRRDGSETVIKEIQEKSAQFDFLVKHLERFKFKGKWGVIQEYIRGQQLGEYIKDSKNVSKAPLAVIELANTLNRWHSNGFAHGDGHLGNAMVRENPEGLEVILVDYSLIHHPDFKYCQRLNCFSDHNRKKEDLVNNSILGKGFLHDLKVVESESGFGTSLSDIFIQHYKP